MNRESLYPAYHQRPAWRAMAVHVGKDRDTAETVRKLRILENWFVQNHRPFAFVTPDGRPRSSVICLAVPENEPQKAFDFKCLCNELGIGESIVQWKISAGAGTHC